MKNVISAPSEVVKNTIHIPSSKSISNRMLVIHALAGSGASLHNLSESDDTAVLQQALDSEEHVIDVGHAGTSMRFLTAYLCTRPGEVTLTGSQRMKQRPIGPLVDALKQLGARIDYLETGACPPLKIKGGGIQGGSISIDAGISSQFISALMMIGPVLEGGLTIHLEGEVVNDQNPLWTRMATELTDEDYKDFYRKLYPFSEEPLFWIHLNIDFPFNLKGILYFPKLTNEFDVTKSHIKLFCNQVFVSDNCPELIPEFLSPLQGCLDAPDLPLNVSRSYLQNEPQVRKIRDVIASRVAGKLVELDKLDRKVFSAIWADIHTFIKFGMMRDDKYFEKLKDHTLFALSGSDEWTTLPEYLENTTAAKATTIYYTNDQVAQSTYLKLFKAQGIDVLVLDAQIDSHFIQFMEMKNSEVHFARVDADVTENLIQQGEASKLVDGEDGKTRDERIADLFKECLKDEELEVRVERLKDESVPAMALFSEQDRRFQEMTRTLGKEIKIPDKGPSLLINASSPVVQNILDLHAKQKTDDVALLVAQVFDLAMLTCRAFDQDRMTRFLDRSNQLLARVNAEVAEKD